MKVFRLKWTRPRNGCSATPATSGMKCRTMPSRDMPAGTICSIGPMANTLDWARAHSPIWTGHRFGNIADLAAYDASLAANHLPIEDRTRLSEEEQLRDAVIFGLRLIRGIPSHHLHQHAANYGHTAVTAQLLAQQLIEEDGERSRLSARGRLQADTIAGQLY